MKFRLSFVTVVVSFVLMLALSLPAMAASGKGTVEDPLVWRMGGLYARGVSYGQNYEYFAETVKRLSGGRMIIEVMYDGEGVNASEVLSAVTTGLIEVANPFQALHLGEFPAGVVDLGLPDGPTDLLQVRAMYKEGGWLELVRKAYASIGCYYLGDAPNYGTYLLTKTPVNSLEDLKKMKIRCPGAYGMKLQNLGANTVTMALSEVYSSLASGLLDGVDGCTILDHYEIKSYEMAKYIYKLPVASYQDLGLIANLEAFNKLPDDLKAVLEASAELFGNAQANKSVVWETEALNRMLKAGLQWSPDPSPEDVKKWEAAGRKVWEDFEKKDQYCKELIEAERAFMRRLGHEL